VKNEQLWKGVNSIVMSLYLVDQPQKAFSVSDRDVIGHAVIPSHNWRV